jgi:hypothetical protein
MTGRCQQTPFKGRVCVACQKSRPAQIKLRMAYVQQHLRNRQATMASCGLANRRSRRRRGSAESFLPRESRSGGDAACFSLNYLSSVCLRRVKPWSYAPRGNSPAVLRLTVSCPDGRAAPAPDLKGRDKGDPGRVLRPSTEVHPQMKSPAWGRGAIPLGATEGLGGGAKVLVRNNLIGHAGGLLYVGVRCFV